MKQKATICIEPSTCIVCEKCVKICTSSIFFVQMDDAKKIGLQNTDLCIGCGHCVAVCPTNSITHLDFPKQSIHHFDPALRPSPEQMMNLIRSRRSNRAFSGKEIPETMLNQIIEAAHRAPTASNSQQVSMVLVTNKDVIKELSLTTLDIFSSLSKKLSNPILKPILKPFLPGIYKLIPKLKKLDDEMKTGNDLVLRKAQAVLFFYSPEDSRFRSEEAHV